MEDLLDTLLFDRDLSPEDRSSIRARFDEDPDLAAAWAHWCAVRRRLRDRLETHLSDRRLLVLYVLDQEGATEALTARERTALDEARDDIAQAIEALPALEQVVERIRAEQADFEALWARHVDEDDVLPGKDETTTDSSQPTSGARADRPPRSRSDRDASSRRWTRRAAVAALIVGLAAVAVLFWPQGPSTTTTTVADGAVQVKDLGQGSTVRLVGPATLSYPAADASAPVHRVTLEEGRAYFDVQPRDDASFVVETPTATATVLGTQFGVTTRADTTEVVLATGRVRVDDPDGTGDDGVVLSPGQHSLVAAGEGPTPPKSVDLTGALEWTGLFVFRSMPLDTIAERLSRRYDVQIAVAEPLADEPVTGTFEREQPVGEVLGALAATLGAEVRQDGDKRYRLVPSR
jgi:ferric-dicitrate binding protein FerR (iron transport regulator)